jgi:hypothetical protein
LHDLDDFMRSPCRRTETTRSWRASRQRKIDPEDREPAPPDQQNAIRIFPAEHADQTSNSQQTGPTQLRKIRAAHDIFTTRSCAPSYVDFYRSPVAVRERHLPFK